MMNLILVEREGLRRQAGGGAVYPVRRGQSEAGVGSGGRRGCLTFRGIRTGLRALGRRPGRDSAAVPAQPLLVTLQPVPLPTFPGRPVSKTPARQPPSATLSTTGSVVRPQMGCAAAI